MNYKIEDIEGIGPSYAAKLAQAGITSTGDLLKQCGGKSGRAAVSGKVGVGESTLLKWANLADMMRLKGVGGQYAELLEASGVDTVKELANRNAANLAEKMKELNAAKKLSGSVPTAAVIEGWIAEAKRTEPMISH